MKIGIDLLPLQSDPKRRGISNFVYNLIKEILNLDKKNEYFFFNAKNVELNFIKKSNSKITIINNEITPEDSSKLDIFIFTSFFDFEKKFADPKKMECKVIIIVYDIIPIILWENYIEYFPKDIKFEYFRRINRIRECDKIFTISQSVKKDLVEILEMNENSIDVIYAGINQKDEMPDNKQSIFECLMKKHNIKNKYIFSVPSMDYRKNVFGLIEAYGLLPNEVKKDYQLVISNEMTPDYEIKLREHAIKQKISSQDLIFTNYVSQDELRVLYDNSSLFVFPSFNEGFGLPVLEAMHYGIPVITSNLSSLPEVVGDAGVLINPYCTKEITEAMNKLLVDENLRRELSEKSRIQSKEYSWEKTAKLTLKYCENYYLSEPIPKLGMVTSWNTRCGIAEYSKYLIEGISVFKTLIFANYDDDIVNNDGLNVIRCWDKSSDDYERLFQEIIRRKIDIVHFQFNFGLFNLSNLNILRSKLDKMGIKVIITFHATQDVNIGSKDIKLQDYVEGLKSFNKIIVHTKKDENRFKNLGITKNVVIIPQGIKLSDNRSIETVREEFDIPNYHIISTFGFLLPHKGVLETIKAVSLLKKDCKNIIFFVVSALYPVNESSIYFEKCQQEVKKLGLENNVIFFPNFMDENKINDLLLASNIIVMAYKETQESSSAAVKFALSTRRPILVTDIPIFDEYNEQVYKISSCSPEKIATGIRNLLDDDDLKKNLVNEIDKIIMLENWDAVAKRYKDLLINLYQS